jgi:branched-chain amino acid transport system ATP-binding protein
MLATENLSKSFGSLVAVDNVTLSVAAGSLHAVIGPNGAGKSTFFNLISGFFPPSAGRIVFEGQDVSRLSVTKRVAAGMARTFQITEIFPELGVAMNLRIAVEAASGHPMRPWLSPPAEAVIEGRVAALVSQIGLAGKAERRVGELSHGDQRAVEIGMALALRPKLLLLDEPTAGMGDQETEQIAELMRRLHRDHALTIVLIEHDMPLVFRLAEVITVLNQGRVLASGSPAEIAHNEAVQAAYLGKQES